jgi:hypothetical protein
MDQHLARRGRQQRQFADLEPEPHGQFAHRAGAPPAQMVRWRVEAEIGDGRHRRWPERRAEDEQPTRLEASEHGAGERQRVGHVLDDLEGGHDIIGLAKPGGVGSGGFAQYGATGRRVRV